MILNVFMNKLCSHWWLHINHCNNNIYTQATHEEASLGRPSHGDTQLLLLKLFLLGPNTKAWSFSLASAAPANDSSLGFFLAAATAETYSIRASSVFCISISSTGSCFNPKYQTRHFPCMNATEDWKQHAGKNKCDTRHIMDHLNKYNKK